MLGDFEDEAFALVLGLERIEDRGQMSLELHVDDGTDNLGDAPNDIGFVHDFPFTISSR